MGRGRSGALAMAQIGGCGHGSFLVACRVNATMSSLGGVLRIAPQVQPKSAATGDSLQRRDNGIQGFIRKELE